MKIFIHVLFLVITLNCTAQNKLPFKPQTLYQSPTLTVTQIAENSFLHTSFLQTNDFGNVPCNGLIVRNNQETIIFDTPTTNKSAEELIKWIKEKLNCKIIAVVPTHFHDDCLGGLKAFDEAVVPSYANAKTIELAKQNNYTVPKNSFNKSISLKVGNEKVGIQFLGEGHTRDNVVGYFENDNIIFGGCLIKELGATKGFLGDANVDDWSATVQLVKKTYPNVKIVVPGHGAYGDQQLLDYTINLFKND